MHPAGRSISAIASSLELPLSNTHRLLAELARCGYVRQVREQGDYALTIKLVSLGLSFLSASGIVDVAQPALDRLADESGELVRLAVVDGDDLTFVAKAQGARRGLKYDPDMGLSVQLSCSAAGHAWLSTMTDEAALALVSKQGFGEPDRFGPRAPTTVKGLLAYLRTARKRGFSTISEVFAPSMSSMAAPVRARTGETIGVVTIAGPLVRLTELRMEALADALLKCAEEIEGASGEGRKAPPIWPRGVTICRQDDRPLVHLAAGSASGRRRRCRYPLIPGTGLAMARAPHLFRLNLVIAVSLAAVATAAAGGGTGDPGKRPSNSFNLLATAAAPLTPVRSTAAGTGLAPKSVVSNPYQVPLIQNAGTFA